MKFEKQITSAVKRCFSVDPRVVFTTQQLLPATKKVSNENFSKTLWPSGWALGQAT